MSSALELPPDLTIAPESTTLTDPTHVEASPLRLLFVLGPAYGLMGFGLYASWRLRSAPAVLGVTLLATMLAGLTCTSFSTVKAAGGGMRLEVQKELRVKAPRKHAVPRDPKAVTT